MKYLITVILVVCCTVGAVGQTGPSLQETLNWLDNTYNGGHRALFQQWVDNSEHHLATEYSQRFEYQQCRITTLIMRPFDDAEDERFTWVRSDLQSFKLADIEPSTIKVIPHSSRYMSDCTDRLEVAANKLQDCDTQAEVVFSARNENPVISYKMHTVYPRDKRRRP